MTGWTTESPCAFSGGSTASRSAASEQYGLLKCGFWLSNFGLVMACWAFARAATRFEMDSLRVMRALLKLPRVCFCEAEDHQGGCAGVRLAVPGQQRGLEPGTFLGRQRAGIGEALHQPAALQIRAGTGGGG